MNVGMEEIKSVTYIFKNKIYVYPYILCILLYTYRTFSVQMRLDYIIISDNIIEYKTVDEDLLCCKENIVT